MSPPDPSFPPPRPVTPLELLDYGDLRTFMRIRAGEGGVSRILDHPRIQKSGLMFAGHMVGVVPTRVQILGETEISFIEAMSPEVRGSRVDAVFAAGLSCVVVTRGVEPPAELVRAARETDTLLLVSDKRSSHTISALHAGLDAILSPRQSVHGVLVDIYGVGVLLLGPSGIGKSECALFLVERGHRLVADDQVVLALRPSGRIEGHPPRLLRYHMEVRGIGILNIRDLFGATSVRPRKTVDLVVELCPWREDQEYERLGLDDQTYEILGTPVPMLRMPVTPGRDMGVLLEVAARNRLLQREGEHSARRFAANLARELLPESADEVEGQTP